MINKDSAWNNIPDSRRNKSLDSGVPNPLFMEIKNGSTDIQLVMTNNMALTKLNYNACIHADGKLVTLRFAELVGDILTSASLNRKEAPPLSFKYYI